MNEREYVKVNTSIQTGSNASTLHKDEDGNVEAVIELRLPDNLFDDNSGRRVLDSVDLKTTKMRLSMAQLPIAKIPMDEDLTNIAEDLLVSTMQLDVYPFCILDNGQLYPATDRTDILAFPNYKNKGVRITIFDNLSQGLLKQWAGVSNDIYNPMPSEIIEVLNKCHIDIMHLMNLCIQSNHEKFSFPITSRLKELYIKNIGTLEQILQDALENAFTYALSQSATAINVYLDPTEETGANTVEIDGIRYKVHNYSIDKGTPSTTLTNAFKPIVKIGAQSITISYDSGCFSNVVPIIWNPAFVDTDDHPEQMTLDKLRNIAWGAPPIKKIYQYPIVWNQDNSYTYGIPTSNVLCAPCNLVVNQAFKDTFSFLPWIKFDPVINPTQPTPTLVGYTVTMEADTTFKRQVRTYSSTLDNTMVAYYQQYNKAGQDWKTMPSEMQAWFNDKGAMYYGRVFVKYVFKVQVGKDPNDVANRSGQDMYLGLGTLTETYQTVHADEGYAFHYIAESVDTSSRQRNKLLTKSGPFHTVHDINNVVISSRTTPMATEMEMEETGDKIYNGVGNQRIAYIRICQGKKVVYIGQNFGGSWASGATGVYRNLPSPYIDDYWYSSTTSEGYQNFTCIFPCEEVVKMENPPQGTWCMEKTNITYSYPGTDTVRYTAKVTNGFDPSYNTIPNLLATEYYLLDGTAAAVNVSSPTLTFKTVASTIHTDKVEVVEETRENHVDVLDNGTLQTSINPSNGDLTYTTSGWLATNIIDTSGFEFYVRIVFPKNKTLQDAIDPAKQVPVRTYIDYTATDFPYLSTETTDVSYSKTIARTTGNLVKQTTNVELDKKTTYYDPSLVPSEYSNITTTAVYTPSSVIQESTPRMETADVTLCCLKNLDASHPNGYWPDYTGFIKFPWLVNIEDAWLEGLPAVFLDSSAVSPDDRPVSEYFQVNTNYTSTEQSVSFCIHLGIFDLRIGDVIRFDSTHIFGSAGLNSASTKTLSWDSIETTRTETGTNTTVSASTIGNCTISYTWDNLPMVVLSPIQSIVLTLEGIHVSQEYQPVNIAQPTGSSLTSTLPVIENYYSLATTLRDLHDELVIVKDEFDDTATYKVSLTGGMQRSVRLAAKFIDKDGSLQPIYIPLNGVFSLQLTFGISYYPVGGNY